MRRGLGLWVETPEKAERRGEERREERKEMIMLLKRRTGLGNVLCDKREKLK